MTDLVASGNEGWQVALLAPGWVHGCLGLWITLRRWPWAQRMRFVLAGAALLLPLLSAAGFWRMASALAAQPAAFIPALSPAARTDLMILRNGDDTRLPARAGCHLSRRLVWRWWQAQRALRQG